MHFIAPREQRIRLFKRICKPEYAVPRGIIAELTIFNQTNLQRSHLASSINVEGIARDIPTMKTGEPNRHAMMKVMLDAVYGMSKPVCDGMTRFGRSASCLVRQKTDKASSGMPTIYERIGGWLELQKPEKENSSKGELLAKQESQQTGEHERRSSRARQWWAPR